MSERTGQPAAHAIDTHVEVRGHANGQPKAAPARLPQFAHARRDTRMRITQPFHFGVVLVQDLAQ